MEHAARHELASWQQAASPGPFKLQWMLRIPPRGAGTLSKYMRAALLDSNIG